MKQKIAFFVNDTYYETQIDTNLTLLDLLRNHLGLPGTKRGCEKGDCGTCIILVDGTPVNACLYMAVRAKGKKISTVEGLETETGLHPLQKSFVEYGAVQCGFCTPGMLMTGVGLLQQKPFPTEAEVRTAISGNLCRCTGYQHIVDAILSTAEKMGTNTNNISS